MEIRKISDGLLPNQTDILNIVESKGRCASINASVTHIGFQDNDTKQYVFYIPSFDLSGYGSTKEAAREMAHQTIATFLKNLKKLTPKQIRQELALLGWHRNAIKSKSFSKSFVDSDGVLNDFNMVDDKVEVLVETI